jgi:hypothetical protein
MMDVLHVLLFMWQKETKAHQKKTAEKLSESHRSPEGILAGEYFPWVAVHHKGFGQRF